MIGPIRGGLTKPSIPLHVPAPYEEPREVPYYPPEEPSAPDEEPYEAPEPLVPDYDPVPA